MGEKRKTTTTTFFGRNLYAARMKLNISRSVLAYMSGINVRSISNYEQGIREPNARAAIALAGAVGMSLESLMSRVPLKQPKRSPGRPPGVISV